MSLATRCPHCQTAFQVTENQLKSHSGMVTCGVCKKSFNAIDELIGRVPVLSESDLPQENALSREDKLKELFDKKLAPLNLDLPKPQKQQEVASPAVNTQEKEPHLDSTNSKQEVAPEVKVDTPKPTPVEDKKPVKQDSFKNEIKQIAPPPKKQSSTFWWWIGALILLLILIGQGVYFYSEKIISALPGTKNAVTNLCRMLNCPVKKVVVAPIVLNIKPGEVKKSETQPNTYTQTVAISNLSDRATAWPILSLEILSQDNRVLSKQYITPARYLPTSSDTAINVAGGKTELVTLSFDFKTEDPFTTRISIVRQPSI